MRKRSRFMLSLPAAAAAVMLAVGPVYGRASSDAPAPAREAAAAAPAARAALGHELERLNALAGRWTVRQSMWTDPAKPPAVDHGVATLTPVLGGRHLRQDLRLDSPTGSFQGLGYLGYDPATQQYDSLWMDVNFTGMILAHGSYDPARQAYTFMGAVPDPKQGGATSPLREVLRVKDPDHFTYEYYERHDGAERLAVRLEYARVK